MTVSSLHVMSHIQCQCLIRHKLTNFICVRLGSVFVRSVFGVPNIRTPLELPNGVFQSFTHGTQSNVSVNRYISSWRKTQLTPRPSIQSQRKTLKQSNMELVKRQRFIDAVLYGPILSKKGEKKDDNSPWITDETSSSLVGSSDAKKSQTFTTDEIILKDHCRDDLEPVEPPQNVTSKTEISKPDLGNMDSIFLFPLFSPPTTQNVRFGNFQTAEPLDIPGVTDSLVRLPSVTSILSKTMSPEARFFLDRWEKEMIAELGEEGFAKYKQELFRNGSNFHSCIERHLGGTTEDELGLSGANEGYWSSVKGVFPDIGDVTSIEQTVQHPRLHYRGVFDCIAKYKDQLCVIDWKTSKRQKADIRYTYDNPLQLAAYMGAVNFDPKFSLKPDSTLLVIAYQDGSPAHTHLIPRQKCVHYWGLWLQRLHTYWRTAATQHTSL